jgi:hypothetical protein
MKRTLLPLFLTTLLLTLAELGEARGVYAASPPAR